MTLERDRERKSKSRLSRRDLKKIHEKRSEKAQQIDESLRAPMPPSLTAWAKQPDQYDISGIDYPEEWRRKDEIERLEEINKYLPTRQRELQERKKKGEDTKHLEETIKIFSKTRDLLIWQKKHPFIGAGIDDDQVGYGKENYDWALKNKVDYGFNLRDPEASFIRNFHLKKHDVKGMRVVIEKDNKRSYGARAWYEWKTHEFHLPPESYFENSTEKWTQKSILHEIGHHVHSMNNDELNSFWAGMYYTFNYPVKRGKKFTGEVRKTHEAPHEMIYSYRWYFGDTAYFEPRYGAWNGTPLKKSILNQTSFENKTVRMKEMWAEAFAQYRLGNLSKERKYKRYRIDLIESHTKRKEKELTQYPGPKSSKEYKALKREIRDLSRARTAALAQYDNLLKFEKMMKRWDRRGWKPNYEEEMNRQ